MDYKKPFDTYWALDIILLKSCIYLFNFFFFWLHWVLGAVWGAFGFRCGMWDLVSWPGIEPKPLALQCKPSADLATGPLAKSFFLLFKNNNCLVVKKKKMPHVPMAHPLRVVSLIYPPTLFHLLCIILKQIVSSIKIKGHREMLSLDEKFTISPPSSSR